jgi:hypothetical protein
MKHLVMTSWSKENRSEKIKRILESLSQSGQAEAEYFKGASYISWLLLGRGKAKPVHEDDDWIQVKVFYNGKCALDIFDPARDGHYFDSRFTNAENQHIVHALKKAEILTWRDYLSRHKRLGKVARPIWAVSALAGAVGVVRGVLAHDLVNVFLFSVMAVGFAFFVLRK